MVLNFYAYTTKTNVCAAFGEQRVYQNITLIAARRNVRNDGAEFSTPFAFLSESISFPSESISLCFLTHLKISLEQCKGIL